MLKNSLFPCFYPPRGVVFIQNASNGAILGSQKSQENAQRGPQGRLGRLFWMTGRDIWLRFWFLKQIGLIFFRNSCCKLIFHNILTKQIKKRPSGPSKPMEIIQKTRFFEDVQAFTFSLFWSFLGSFFSPKSFQWYCFDVPKVPVRCPKESRGTSWEIMLDDCEIFLHKTLVHWAI